MVYFGFCGVQEKPPDVMTPHDAGIGHLGRAGGWGPVVPGVYTVHRLVLTPTVTTLEPHAALCPTIKFLCFLQLIHLAQLTGQSPEATA